MSLKSVSIEVISHKIFFIRGRKVMLDSDLAKLYGVSTKRLNEQVKRNRQRFPPDFMLRLTRKETEELVANCDRLQSLKHSVSLPHVFTEQGVAMLSSVLNSERAVQVNIAIMRAFVKLREILGAHKDLAKKIEELERKYDGQFRAVFEAIRRLMIEGEKPKRKIGFHA